MPIALSLIASGSGVANLANSARIMPFDASGTLYVGTIASDNASFGRLYSLAGSAWAITSPLTPIASATGYVRYTQVGSALYVGTTASGVPPANTGDVYRFNSGTGLWSALGIQSVGFGNAWFSDLCAHGGNLYVLRWSPTLSQAEILQWNGFAWSQALNPVSASLAWLGLLSFGGTLYAIDGHQNLYSIAAGAATLVAATPFTSFLADGTIVFDSYKLHGVGGQLYMLNCSDPTVPCLYVLNGGTFDVAGGIPAGAVTLTSLITFNGSLYGVTGSRLYLLTPSSASSALTYSNFTGFGLTLSGVPYLIQRNTGNLYTLQELASGNSGAILPTFIPGIGF